jgi:hypothetical protein
MGNTKHQHQKRFARATERFLNLPIPVVLAALWLIGLAIMSVSVLALYLFWLALKGVAGG